MGMLRGGILATLTTNVRELKCVVQFGLYLRTCTRTIVCCPIVYGTIVQWLYNCTLRPMVVFVCCHFCLDAQVFHTAGARVCLFPTKGIQVQEYILGGMHFMKIHTRNNKALSVQKFSSSTPSTCTCLDLNLGEIDFHTCWLFCSNLPISCSFNNSNTEL